MRRILSLVAATLLLAACGGTSSSGAKPKETLKTALANLEEMPGTTATMTLQSTTASLRALAADDGDVLSAEDAQKILDSSVSVSASNEDDPAEAVAQVVVNVAGEDSLELRMVGETLYARADVRRLLETFGQDPGIADAFAQQAAASGMSFVRPFVDGRWVSIAGLNDAVGQSTAATPSEQQKKALDELLSSLGSSASVSSEGEDESGQHLVATVDLRDVVRHMQDAARGVGGGLPAAPPLPDPEEVPKENISIDLWVDDERLSQIEFDFLQLSEVGDADIPVGVERLALRLALEEFSGEVEVPPDAVAVDVQQLMQGMLGLDPAGGFGP